jgi:nitrogen fixation NifU-like protein
MADNFVGVIKLNNMYSKKVLDHFKNPRNQGELKNANAVAQKGNPTCGDVMKIYLKVNDEGIIEEVSFETLGCAAAIAVSSLMTEYIKGMTVEEAKKVTKDDIVKEADGLPPDKIHCSMLVVDAALAALKNYEENK